MEALSLVALVSIACVENFNSVVQTTTADQKISNITATAEVLIAAGIDPSARNVAIGKGSLAEKVVQTQEAERLERLAAGESQQQEKLVELPNGEFVTAALATEIAEFGTDDQPINAPDGLAASGETAVNIVTTGKMVPSVLKITSGTTVTWTNTERTGHSTKSDPGQAEEWDSESMARGPLDVGTIATPVFSRAGRNNPGKRPVAHGTSSPCAGEARYQGCITVSTLKAS